MNKLFTMLAAILIMASILPQQAGAQSPERVSYQAIIRNSSNALVTNTQVGMRISILQGSVNGTVVYFETQTPISNANGLVSIQIGVEAAFKTINWADGPYFIKTETDPTGGTSYTITGTSQLLSVPYALHAKTAENVTNETDPLFTTSEANDITNAGSGAVITSTERTKLSGIADGATRFVTHTGTLDNPVGTTNAHSLFEMSTGETWLITVVGTNSIESRLSFSGSWIAYINDVSGMSETGVFAVFMPTSTATGCSISDIGITNGTTTVTLQSTSGKPESVRWTALRLN